MILADLTKHMHSVKHGDGNQQQLWLTDLRDVGDKPNQPSFFYLSQEKFGELKPWPHHNLFSTPSPDYSRAMFFEYVCENMDGCHVYAS